MTYQVQDRWEFADGSRFVERDEWARYFAENRRSLVRIALTTALAQAADDDGQILDYRLDEFYERHVSAALRDEDDLEGWTLTYDRFAATVLMDAMSGLVEDGYLAHRGNGDSCDYRLALPALDGDPMMLSLDPELRPSVIREAWLHGVQYGRESIPVPPVPNDALKRGNDLRQAIVDER